MLRRDFFPIKNVWHVGAANDLALLDVAIRNAEKRLGLGIRTYPSDAKGKATRDSGSAVENAIAKHGQWLIGRPGDLYQDAHRRRQ